MLSKEPKHPDLSLGFILNNPTALSFFIDFLGNVKGGQDLMYLFLTIEGFKVSAAYHAGSPDGTRIDLESVREAAITLYDNYLANGAGQRLGLDDASSKS